MSSLRVILCGLTSVFLFCLESVPGNAEPVWYNDTTKIGLNTGVPDFFQHQSDVFRAPFPYTDGGYCYSTAFLDGLYYLADRYSAPELYPQAASRNWLDGMVQNLQSVITTFENPNPHDPNFLVTYLNNHPGHAWTVTQSTNSGNNFDIFNAYSSELLAEQAVLVHIVPNGLNNWWWSYHVLAGVGIDENNHEIIFADPDTTKYQPGAGHPDPGFCGTVGGRPCTPTGDYNRNDPFPSGGAVGNFDNSYYQEFAVDAQGVIQGGTYAGAKIDFIYDVSPVPEPSAFALVGLGLAGIVFVRRRKQS